MRRKDYEKTTNVNRQTPSEQNVCSNTDIKHAVRIEHGDGRNGDKNTFIEAFMGQQN